MLQVNTTRSIYRGQLDRIAEKLGIKQQSDWYNYSVLEVKKQGSSSILHQTNDSLSKALSIVYPEFEWHPVLFRNIPRNYWKDLNNQKEYFDKVASLFGITTQEDWYSLSVEEISIVSKEGLLHHYKDSLFHALCNVYPQFDWNPFKFRNTPHCWKDKKNHRKHFDRIGEDLGVVTQEDWYSLKLSQFGIYRASVTNLLSEQYKSSLPFALQSIYPEFTWNPLLFRSNIDYNKKLNRRRDLTIALSNIGDLLGVERQEDWYRVTAKDVLKFEDGHEILSYYKGSLFTALKSSYPQYDWNPLLCAVLPSKHLKNIQFNEIKSIFSTQESLSSSQSLFRKVARLFGGRMKMLHLLFPDVNWSKRFHGSFGEDSLQNLLERYAVIDKHKKIKDQSVDFYLPETSLAFEFQGGQHYFQTHVGSFAGQHDRDQRKKQLLQQLNIKLVTVPYWWRGGYLSLLATVNKHS